MRQLRIAVVSLLAGLLPSTPLDALGQQRVRFPDAAPIYPGTYPGPPGSVAFPSSAPGGAVLNPQIQPFDPYGTSSSPFGVNSGTVYAPPATVPGTQPWGNSSPSLPGVQGGVVLPPVSVPGGMAPAFPAPGTPTPGTAVPVFPSGTPQFPSAASPAASSAPVLPPTYLPAQPPPLNGTQAGLQPVPLFPQGMPWGNDRPYERLFQDTGFLHTYLYGDSGDDLGMHDVDIFTSVVFQNFLHSPYPLRISPGFTFHFLDGPAVPGKIDLPGQLYSAYVNGLWQPRLAPQFGADLNFRAGVYSDLDSVTWNSIRFTGRGLGVLKLTPTTTFKLGVEYLDRGRIKILPAGGLLWEPNPQSRLDLYFPRPKYSQYWTTWGNTEFWWHVGGEYGGGSWTINRLSDPHRGTSERIDINDLRVFLGVHWNRLDRMDGVFEVGYVFDREVWVKEHADERLNLSDTVMIRSGIKF